MAAIDLFVSNSGDMSQTTVIAGPMDVRTFRNIAVACNYTGAPVGSLQLQGIVANPTASGTGAGAAGAGGSWPSTGWVNQGTSVAVNGASSYVWDVSSSVSALRIVYTKTSGTGTLTANCQPKGRV